MADLVSTALTLRAGLDLDGDAALRLARNLDYDVVLVRLCEATGVEHQLTEGIPELIARQKAESRLVERLPALRPALLPIRKD